MRSRLCCGNWKMHKTLDEATRFVDAFAQHFDAASRTAQVVLFPPAPFLYPLAQQTKDSAVAIGAQACHHEESGAFTGATSCDMAASTGATWTLVGHSERRRIFGEQDEELNLQLRGAFFTGLTPILCVGETLSEREAGRTFAVITQQLTLGLLGFNPRELKPFAVAYEPVWAIGTGKTATVEEAQEVHRFIRETLAQRFNAEVGEATPILYGGSVKPNNAAGLMAQADIDGVLVGGASLDPERFANIAEAVDTAGEASSTG